MRRLDPFLIACVGATSIAFLWPAFSPLPDAVEARSGRGFSTPS